MAFNGNNHQQQQHQHHHHQQMDEGLPIPLLLSPAPARHSWSSSSASPMSMAASLARHISPRKRLFEGPSSSSPPPSPVPFEKSPYRRSLFHGARGHQPPSHRFADHDGAWPARQVNGRWSAEAPAKRLRLDVEDLDTFLPPRPLRLDREQAGEKEGVVSLLLERAKPDLFSEDCDAAAPGSSAPLDALSALDQDEDRCTPEEPPAISVTPATPHGADALTPVLPSAHLTPPGSPQPLSRHLHSTPHGHHANLIHLATPSRTCNVNPFSPERALPRHVPSSPMPSPCPSPVRGAPPSPAGARYLEDFEEIEKIGTGSFSEVFKARNRVDGWLYAVKQAKRAFSSPADMHNTLKEVYALAALGSHPHVVRYYSAWVEDRLYIQTEYCSGGSLADHLKKGVRFTEAQLLDVLRQVAQGLSHIHKKGLAHLDVKPENIYVDLQDDGITPLYKIGDLGLISLADATDFSEGDSRYISRDLFASDADCRKLTKADVFSLGCSVYELALGRALPSRGEEWNAIREGEIQLSSDFTKGFVNLLKSMLAADADKRPSADELLQAPVMCSDEMKWDIEHKKRIALEEQVRALQAELNWRREAMDSSGWRACESLVPLVAKLEGYISYLAPPSPISADSSPRPGL